MGSFAFVLFPLADGERSSAQRANGPFFHPARPLRAGNVAAIFAKGPTGWPFHLVLHAIRESKWLVCCELVTHVDWIADQLDAFAVYVRCVLKNGYLRIPILGRSALWCQANGTDFGKLVVTNTPKEVRHIARGCRVSRLPWECVQEMHLPRMGYVKNADGTPLGYRGGSSRPRVAHFVSNPGL